jgi:hypothetical protein
LTCRPAQIWSIAAAAVMVHLVAPSAQAQTERALADRYCGGAGMATEVTMPDGTFADCISPTHAIEVDFTHKWAEAIGQSLHYALWTADPLWTFDSHGPRRAGIILLCTSANEDTCTDHFVRLYRIVEAFKLPVTIWDCNPRTDATLEDCVRVEGGDLQSD